MKTTLQVLFGLLLAVASLAVSVFLGLLLNGSPDWRSAAVFLLLIAVGQWVAFWTFRRHIARQVLFGVVLCMVIGYLLIYSTVPMFWEHEESAQHGVYTLTWRSDLMFLLLLAITQAISFLIFRWVRSGRVADPSGE